VIDVIIVFVPLGPFKVVLVAEYPLTTDPVAPCAPVGPFAPVAPCAPVGPPAGPATP
jgi:hypothetical protein